MDAQIVFKGVRFNLLQKGHYQWIDHPGAVVVLPFLEDGQIVMIRNFRVAVDQELWELPAGTLEPGESPLQTAYRELEEETGYRAEAMEPLPIFYTSPGINNEIMYPFVARNLIPTAQNLDAGEQIQVEVIPFEKALQLARDGAIRDGKSLATLLYYHTFT